MKLARFRFSCAALRFRFRENETSILRGEATGFGRGYRMRAILTIDLVSDEAMTVGMKRIMPVARSE